MYYDYTLYRKYIVTVLVTDPSKPHDRKRLENTLRSDESIWVMYQDWFNKLGDEVVSNTSEVEYLAKDKI